ncbi:MAG: type IV pilus twitching motility protein PilT [Bdellovibrionales bacterium]
MAEIDKLFKLMKEKGASDLHLTTGAPALIRQHGSMVPLVKGNMSAQDVQSLVFEILTEKEKKDFVQNWELDCAYSLEGVGRFRVNVFMQRKGLGSVFRIIPEKIMTAGELGLPPQILDLTKEHKGLIVVTGPTGSGKSTTLAAMIDHINKTQSAHILTVEDPVEFVHQNQMSLVNQREVGNHTKSFSNALKAALREDPDIILVGEMRDLETISLAMTAAETGHLVFGTLHTNNAAKTVDRIIDVFPQEQQEQIRVMLSESLKGVIAQGLLPTADGKGRCAALEVLVSTHAIGNLIREGKTFQIPSIMQTGSSHGMITFEHSIRALVETGKITHEVGMSFLGKKDEKADSKSKPDPLKKVTATNN